MKKVVIFLLLSSLVFLAGWYLKKPEVIVKPKIEIVENLKRVKRLEGEIIEYKNEIDSLKKSRQKVKVIIQEKIVEVHSLPADSSVSLLRNNLEVSPEDSFPALQEDSTVLLSQENVKDINVMYLKYDGLQEENKLLEEQVGLEDSIIFLKDSIIFEKDTIAETKLIKEKKKKRLWAGISGGLVVIIGLLIAL